MSQVSPDPTCRRVLSGAGARGVAQQTGLTATVGQILLARLRNRLGLVLDPSCAHARAAVLAFLSPRHAAPTIAG